MIGLRRKSKTGPDSTRQPANEPRRGNSRTRSAPGWMFSLTLAIVCPLQAAGTSFTDVNPERAWIGPDGQTLPFRTDQEVLDFLLTARIVSFRAIGRGINNTRKVLLEKNGVTANAVFRDVHVTKDRTRSKGKMRLFFRDEAGFEVAAYRLSRLLGLNNVPPTVQRSVFGKRGTLQLWIENAFTEAQRIENHLWPEDPELWRLQVQVLRLFDNLIFNDDRNQGNVLFDSNWKLWLIDHTRSFRRDRRLPYPGTLTRCERSVWERLHALEPDRVKEALREHLHPAEVRGLLERHRLVLAHIDRLIEENGEEAVFFDLPLIRSDHPAPGTPTTTGL